MKQPQFFSLNRRFVFLAFLLVGLILYGLILQTPFKTMDDFYAIILNKQIKTVSMHNIKEILTTSFFGDNTYYRPLVNLSFMVEYKFFKLNSFFYNLDNILIHIFNAWLVFLILLRICKENAIAIFAAFLFLIHPIQVEGIANIPGRSILLCSLFSLLSFYFYLVALSVNRLKTVAVAGSLFCYGVSLLAKESAITLPLVIIAYQIIFKDNLNYNRQKVVIGLFFLLTAIYLMTRKLFGFTSAFEWGGVGQTIFGVGTFLKSVLISLQLLILPVELYYDRSMELFKSSLDPFFWLVLIFWFVILGWFLIRIKFISKLVLFCIAWFWINLLLVSQIIPVKISLDHISTADHFLYLPSIGFFVCLVVVLRNMFSLPALKAKVSVGVRRALIVSWIMFLMLATLQYNIYSSQQISLYEHSLEYNPKNLRVRTALASAYGMNGQYLEAKKNFDYILKDVPWDVRAHLGLAKLYIDQGKYWESIKENELFPHAGLMEDVRVNNLNYAYEELIKQYQERIKNEPKNARLIYSFAVILSKHNQAQEAVKNYELAILLDPTFKNSYFNLASIQEAFGNWQKAIENYEASIKLSGDDASMDLTSYRQLANLYALKLNDQAKAFEYSQKALELEKEFNNSAK